MRVLFLIPKNNPPQLTGNYSKQFKEFVEACLNKDPENVRCLVKQKNWFLSNWSIDIFFTEADSQRAVENALYPQGEEKSLSDRPD